jgi:hypothetical protein
VNTLLVKLTEASTRQPFFLDAANIRMTTRSAENALVTMVITYTMTQKGPQAYEVLESPEEAARLINAGRLGRDLLTS